MSAVSYLYQNFYLETVNQERRFLELQTIAPELLPREMAVFTTENRWMTKFDWYLNHQVKSRGEGKETLALLENGETIGVLTTSDPVELITPPVDRELEAEIIFS